MKPHTPEYVEGPEALARFQNAMKAVLASKDGLQTTRKTPLSILETAAQNRK
jgi:hypothetical protein